MSLRLISNLAAQFRPSKINRILFPILRPGKGQMSLEKVTPGLEKGEGRFYLVQIL